MVECLGLPQAFLKQTILSGQVGLGDPAALSVLLVLCKFLLLVFLVWRGGRVSQLPTVSQDQPILSVLGLEDWRTPTHIVSSWN